MALLQVQAGDEIDLKVYVKYDQGGNDTNVEATGLVAALGNMFGSASSPGEGGSAFNLFDQAAQAMTGFMTGEGGTEPDAYLQYLFFDKDFNFTGTLGDGYDFDKVDADAALTQHDSLSLSRTFTKDGYLFVFISNSSPEIPVYFDDLTIDYTMSPIDQANDYYPFGALMGSGFERIISKTNDFRYQGKEYDKDLQWYDFHARQYDPYLGRFLAADPLMQFSSPYNGMGNNPINLIDPTGMGAYNGAHGDPTPERDEDNEDSDAKNNDYVPGSLRDRFLATAVSGGWMLRGSSFSGFGSDMYGVNYGAAAGGSNVNANYEYAHLQARRLGGSARHTNGEYYIDVPIEEFTDDDDYQGWGPGVMSIRVSNMSSGGVQQASAFGYNMVEDTRNILTGLAIAAEADSWRKLRKTPNWAPTKKARELLQARRSWLALKAAKAGGIGLVFSGWEATEKGWTTGATASFAADAIMVGVTIACPVCGLVYGGTRVIIDMAGYDIADQIDATFGANYGAAGGINWLIEGN